MRTRISFIIVFIILLAAFATPLGRYFFPHVEPPVELARSAVDFDRLSRTLSDKKQFHQAELAAKAALALEPGMYKALIDLGRVYLDTGNYIKAAAVLEKALQSVGDDRKNLEVIYYDLGLAYAAEQKEQLSWESFRKAYAIQKVFVYPRDWSSRLLKTVADNDRKGFKEELPRAAMISGLNRTLEQWQEGLNKHRYAEVLTSAREHLKDNPGTIHVFPLTGRIVEALDSMGRHEEAMRTAADAERSAADGGLKQKFASLRARSLLSQKQYQEALNIYSSLDSLMSDPVWQEHLCLSVSFIIQQSRAGVDLAGWLASPIPEKYKQATQLFMAEQLLRRGKVSRASSQITELISHVEQQMRAYAPETEAKAVTQKEKKTGSQSEGQVRHKRRQRSRSGKNLREKGKAAPVGTDGTLQDREQSEFQVKMYYLASSIYEANDDLPRAKSMVFKAIDASPLGPRGLPARIAYLRLMQLNIKSRDYEAAFENFFASGFGIVLNALDLFFVLIRVSLFIAFFGWFSRRFFPHKWQSLRGSETFRLKDFGMFLFLLAALGPQLFIPLLAWNYYSGGTLSVLHLDPILLSSKLMQLVLIFVAVYVLHRQYRLDYPSLGFISRGFKVNVLLPLAVFLAPIVVGVLLSFLYMHLGTEIQDSIVQNLSRNIMLQRNNAFDVWFLFMSLAVLTPIAEEIVFRIFIFRFLEKFTNVFWGVFISAAMFALAHEQKLLFPYYFAIGLILAIMVHKTKSIVPCIALHALYNSIAFFTFWFG